MRYLHHDTDEDEPRNWSDTVLLVVVDAGVAATLGYLAYLAGQTFGLWP